MPSAFRHSAVMMNRVRRAGPPSVNANGARFSRSSTRCRTSPPSATRAIEYPPRRDPDRAFGVEADAVRAEAVGETRRPDSPPSASISNAVSPRPRPARPSTTRTTSGPIDRASAPNPIQGAEKNSGSARQGYFRPSHLPGLPPTVVASGIGCKSAGVVPGFMIRLGDGTDGFRAAAGLQPDSFKAVAGESPAPSAPLRRSALATGG